MQTLNIQLPATMYPVHIGAGLLSDTDLWAASLPAGKLLVVSDENVAPLYLDSLLGALEGRDAEALLIPAGEAEKTFANWRRVTDRLVELGALRDATVIALGGGVIGDLAGFAAASYMRGIRFVQAPTTLLAQVDASVGGKTAINHPAGKNLVGAFHQPSAVIIDTETLNTLPAREFRAGMAEVVKYGAIRDPEYMDWLESHAASINGRAVADITAMIARSVENKAAVVSEDEKEQGVRALLNFGHTFAHAIETLTGYERYLHGEAVAIGMVTAALLSEQLGHCPAGTAKRLEVRLGAFGLETAWPPEVDADSAVNTMAMDKKALDSGLRLILLRRIGEAFIAKGCNRRDILRAIESHTERAV